MSLLQFKNICCGLVCTALLISNAFAYTQQLIMAEPSTQQAPQQNSPAAAVTPPVLPTVQAPASTPIQTPNEQPTPPQPIPQQPIQVSPTQNSPIVAELITNPQPQPSTATTTNPTSATATSNPSNEPNSIIAPVAASDSDPNKAGSQYSDNEKQAWFKSCISGVTDKKMSGYAQEFCNCGWTHISSGQLPPDYLTNTSPDKIKQANSILRVISQQCLVDLRSSHNLG